MGDTRSASAPKSSRARLADRKHRDNIWDRAVGRLSEMAAREKSAEDTPRAPLYLPPFVSYGSCREYIVRDPF